MPKRSSGPFFKEILEHFVGYSRGMYARRILVVQFVLVDFEIFNNPLKIGGIQGLAQSLTKRRCRGLTTMGHVYCASNVRFFLRGNRSSPADLFPGKG